MIKYIVTCSGCTMSTHDSLIEAVVELKRYAKKFGIDNVFITASSDNIVQTIKLIISKEDL